MPNTLQIIAAITFTGLLTGHLLIILHNTRRAKTEEDITDQDADRQSPVAAAREVC